MVLPHDVEHRVGRRTVRPQHRRCADRHRERERVAHAVGEEKLRRREHDVVLANPDNIPAHQRRGGGRRGLHVLHALGIAGRARGVHPERDLVGIGRGDAGLAAFARENVFEQMHVAARKRRLVGRRRADQDHGAQLGQAVDDRRDRLGERRLHHDRAGAAVVEHIGVLRLGEQDIQRQSHDSAADRAEESDRKIDGVEQQQRHAAFLADAERLERARELAAARLQLAVGQRAFRIGEGDLAAEPARDIAVDEIGGGVIRPALHNLVDRQSHARFLPQLCALCLGLLVSCIIPRCTQHSAAGVRRCCRCAAGVAFGKHKVGDAP